jgi:hypothetical protein
MKAKILENEKFIWYTTDETLLSKEYLKVKGLENYYVSQCFSKADSREEYVLLRADDAGQTSAVFASSQMTNVIEYIDSLSNTLNSKEAR